MTERQARDPVLILTHEEKQALKSMLGTMEKERERQRDAETAAPV